MIRKLSATLAMISVISVSAITATAQDTVLLEESFEGVTLGPNVDEGEAGDTVWTADAPAGWSVTSDMPTNGVTEWLGWTFASAEWWTAAAGDQERSQFTNTGAGGLGVGVVAIADPDEYDDLNSALSGGAFNSWLSSPAIDISGMGNLWVTFDSSWRPEDTQAADLTVSYDGGDAVTLMSMTSVGTDTDYQEPQAGIQITKPDLEQVNETLSIGIPANGNSIVLTWGMLNATNDWWWAIDNISVTGSVSTAVEAEGKAATTWATLKDQR